MAKFFEAATSNGVPLAKYHAIDRDQFRGNQPRRRGADPECAKATDMVNDSLKCHSAPKALSAFRRNEELTP